MPAPEIKLRELKPYSRPIPEVSDVVVGSLEGIFQPHIPSRFDYSSPMGYGEYPRRTLPQAIRIPTGSQRFNIRQAVIIGVLNFVTRLATSVYMDVIRGKRPRP